MNENNNTPQDTAFSKTAVSGSFYFCDVEDGCLYELKKSKQKTLLKNHPKWYDYSLDSDGLQDVLLYFKKYGKLVGNTRNKSLFVGFTA